METRILHFVAIFIVILCVFGSCEAEDNRRLLNNGNLNFQDVDQQTVDQFLSLCREESTNNAGVAETFKSYLHQTLTDKYLSVDSDDAFLSKNFIDKGSLDLSPQERDKLLDCLREENSFVTSYKCKVIQSKMVIGCPELVRDWSFVPRRNLQNKRIRKRISKKKRLWNRSNANPGSQVRTNAPAPSPTPVPSPSPSPISGSPSPAKSPKVQISPPANAPNSSPPLKPQHAPSKDKENQHRTLVVAAISVSVVAGIALIAFFLFWLLRRGTKYDRPKDRNRDDNPLLKVYSSDLSAVSSQRSQTSGISTTKDFITSSRPDISFAEAGNLTTTVPEASGGVTTNLPLPPGKPAAPPPQPPGPPPPKPPAPSPPPPPLGIRPPPPLRKTALRDSNSGMKSSIAGGKENDGHSDGQKAKMKPFFWDKVQANSDHSMVWNDIKSGSFQLNEDLMESLFGYAPTDQGNDGKKKTISEAGPNYIQIIDPKKAQNLSILLRALNVTTEECCDALNEGNELPAELIQPLIKMAPTSEEELKLQLFKGDVSQLGPAERFLKAMVDIPFAFKRLESILFMGTLQEELSSVKESFATLEVACNDLKNSRLFLKLLEAVLKTGNRMNDGTYRGGANAFKLDTLSKLSDVKGTDGKTTLLHFVVQEIIRSEGVRAARGLKESRSMSSVKTEDLVEDSTDETEEYHRSLGLQVISGLSDELGSVKKASVIDGDNLCNSVSKIGSLFLNTRKFLDNEMKNLEEDNMFRNTLATFMEHTEGDVRSLLEEEKRIMDLVKRTGDYFHGSSAKDEGLRLFVVVRDFLIILDKVCLEVRAKTKMPKKIAMNAKLTVSPSQESRAESVSNLKKKLFPEIQERRASGDDDFSSSDDER